MPDGRLLVRHSAFGSILTWEANQVTTEQELRHKLRKIAALFEGATTAGERDAAAAAIDRIRTALGAAEQTESTVEMRFSLTDRWSRRLFTALCRRYGLKPYRYPRQRHSTVVLRAPASFINQTLWPEFHQIKSALDEYLNEATERIIREEVFGDSEEAEERTGYGNEPPIWWRIDFHGVAGFGRDSSDDGSLAVGVRFQRGQCSPWRGSSGAALLVIYLCVWRIQREWC